MSAAEHPGWCTGKGCAERGWHTSRPLTAPPTDLADVPVVVLAVQMLAPHTEPYLSLTIADHETVMLSVAQARIIGWHLGRTVRLLGVLDQDKATS